MEQVRLEDFWAGKPLNEALARMKAGIEQPAEEQAPERPAFEFDIDRELSRAERIELRNLRMGAGWQIVTRLIQRSLRRRQNAAMLLSQNDPLNHRDEVANEWAYVSVWRSLGLKIEAMVQSEIQLLRISERRAETTGE